jgi:hypothetical protein
MKTEMKNAREQLGRKYVFVSKRSGLVGSVLMTAMRRTALELHGRCHGEALKFSGF